MGKIKVSALIDLFERMAREHWAYEWGAAREGCADCSGAFVYAYKALDGSYIEHGSNSIIRKRVGTLRPIGEAKPGWACFKIRAWTNAQRNNTWYGTEPGDCYHIGLMGRSGLILNAKSSAEGFVSSSPSDGWSVCAPLSAVDYDEEEMEMSLFGNAAVRTESGRLNLRTSASVDGKIIKRLESGTRVDISGATDGWGCANTADGESGYVMMKYIVMDETSPGETTQDAQRQTMLIRDDGTLITLVGSWRVAED